MLSDEEREAIEKIKKFNQYNWEMNNLKGKEFAKPYFESLDTLLNLVEKQSKEIEELKKYEEGYKLLSYSLDNYTSNDKIKAKIEEYENKIKKIRSKKLINEPEDTIVITRYAHYISVLQSLLEKE